VVILFLVQDCVAEVQAELQAAKNLTSMQQPPNPTAAASSPPPSMLSQGFSAMVADITFMVKEQMKEEMKEQMKDLSTIKEDLSTMKEDLATMKEAVNEDVKKACMTFFEDTGAMQQAVVGAAGKDRTRKRLAQLVAPTVSDQLQRKFAKIIMDGVAGKVLAGLLPHVTPRQDGGGDDDDGDDDDDDDDDEEEEQVEEDNESETVSA
jgi:predicted phage-related endonuclease